MPRRETEIDTLGGLVFSLVGRVPSRSEVVRHPSGVEFEILDADPRRVKKVKVASPAAAKKASDQPVEGAMMRVTLGRRHRPTRSPSCRCAVAGSVAHAPSLRSRSAGLSILSMAPFFVWPILWLTLPGVLALLHIAEAAPSAAGTLDTLAVERDGRAAETGWWFGFGYHVFGLFWIVEAFLVEAATFAWLIPLTLLLPAGLALFTAAATAFAAGSLRATDSIACTRARARLRRHRVAARAHPHGPAVERARLRADAALA